MNTAAGNTDKNIACLDGASVYHVFSVNNTYGKSCHIVLFLGHKSRMLSSLTTDKCALRLLAALCHTLYDSSDLLGNISSAGYIVKEE